MPTGTVRGSVMHNGTPADGFQVTIQLQAEGGGDAAPAAGMFGGRGGATGGQNANANGTTDPVQIVTIAAGQSVDVTL